MDAERYCRDDKAIECYAVTHVGLAARQSRQKRYPRPSHRRHTSIFLVLPWVCLWLDRRHIAGYRERRALTRVKTMMRAHFDLCREPTIEFIRTRDVGLHQHADAEVLAYAVIHQLIIISHDVNILIGSTSEARNGKVSFLPLM